jgi:hypothetical protein
MRTASVVRKETSIMWTAMLLIGLAAFAAMYGFTYACDWL